MYGHIGDLAVCGACLRIRFSPVHAVARLTGLCPGERLPADPLPRPPRPIEDIVVKYDANGRWRSS